MAAIGPEEANQARSQSGNHHRTPRKPDSPLHSHSYPYTFPLVQVRLGPLSPHAVRTLRALRDFFGVTFNMKTERDSKTIFMTCIGAGVKNMSKKVT